MKPHRALINASTARPRLTMLVTFVVFAGLGALMPRILIDTDPENMLSPDQPARVFHNEVKKDFSLYDMIVVGVVNEQHEHGVFNEQSLTNIHKLTRHIETIEGVIRHDLMSLASIDNVSQDGPGVIRFEWMMDTPPESPEAAAYIRQAAQRLPTVNGTIISEDARAAAIYVPIVEKKQSHRIAGEIKDFVASFGGNDEFYITGLPVAEDTFGIEMFKQMGIAAPLAALIIFILMFLFFRSLALITAPMILAVVTVVATMGLLIGLGFPVHIMSSMIPIFLMPIAVVDSIHILSEFADVYPRIRDRRKTIGHVLDHLFKPMLYTSLTSAAGFASLAFAPIPPVRVFGIFVAVGILLAFFLTITFIPAYVVMLNDKRIAKLATPVREHHESHWLARFLDAFGQRITQSSRWIIVGTLLIAAVSTYGLTKIEINDNPVRWFRSSHDIRVADRVLNHHFAGTYNAFLVLHKTSEAAHASCDQIAKDLQAAGHTPLAEEWQALHAAVTLEPLAQHYGELIEAVEDRLDSNDAWEDAMFALEDAQIDSKYFQKPEALHYLAGLQEHLLQSQLVGKTSSVSDVVKTLHRELREGQDEHFTIPGTAPAVAQTLLSFQSSHRPHDLWHFITPDYRATNIWVQLKSGDNKDMAAVAEHVESYLAANPLPEGVTVDWAGLTYLNVVWQDEMVSGMFSALWGSFIIVFLMMLMLFRSFWFGLLAMIPLSATILLVYGLIGWIGKDYDMPVAVLSSLTLGLSVDFAIHFLQRARSVFEETRDWQETIRRMFAEPARAIARNAIVISIGFLPLLASPLVPYNTVGLFLAAIMVVSSLATLMLLPAIMNHMRNRLFGHLLRQDHKTTPAAPRPPAAVTTTLATMVLLAGLATAASNALAEETPDVDTIINQANVAAYYAGDDGRSEVRMTITDDQGRKRRRQFIILRKDSEDGGDQDYAVLFSRPADVRNTVFLVNKKPNGSDDRWMYLPDLDLVKRIAAGDKRTSFVGSHFLYEDISGRAIQEDKHEMVEVTDEFYVIRNTPIDPGSVEFSYWDVWIDKTNFLPRRMEYHDDKGELYRRLEAVEIATVGNHPTIITMKAEDLRSGGSTVSQFRNVEYDLGIPDEVFTERTLRSPSRQWFQGK